MVKGAPLLRPGSIGHGHPPKRPGIEDWTQLPQPGMPAAPAWLPSLSEPAEANHRRGSAASQAWIPRVCAQLPWPGTPGPVLSKGGQPLKRVSGSHGRGATDSLSWPLSACHLMENPGEDERHNFHVIVGPGEAC